MYCRQSIQVPVDAEKASEVRRWEVLEDLEIDLVRKIGETAHLACGERRGGGVRGTRRVD